MTVNIRPDPSSAPAIDTSTPLPIGSSGTTDGAVDLSSNGIESEEGHPADLTQSLNNPDNEEVKEMLETKNDQ